MTRRRWLPPVAALVVLGLLAAAWLATHERVEEEVLVGASGLARVNPYYGAELVLGELGLPTRSVFGGDELPPVDHALVLLTTDPAPRAALADELTDWVAAGGHLLLAPADGVGEQEEGGGALLDGDPLLAGLGIVVREHAEPHDTDPGASVLVDLGDRRRVVALSPGPGLVGELESQVEQAWQVEGTTGSAVAVRVPYGDGHVTAVRSTVPFDNDNLGENDHAALLWDLALTHGVPPAGATLMVRSSHDSLATLLWRHAWPALLAGLTLLLAWAWQAAGRLGPLLPPPARARRSTLEHIEASGRFHWRKFGQGRLLASTRAAVLRRLSHVGSVGGTADGGERVHAVARATGLDADLVREALYGGGLRERRQFTRAMQALSRLWSAR